MKTTPQKGSVLQLPKLGGMEDLKTHLNSCILDTELQNVEFALLGFRFALVQDLPTMVPFAPLE